MKLVKSEVEEVTSDALHTAMLALAALKIAGCPYPEWYEFVEEFAAKLDKHRISLGLEPIVSKAFLEKTFSKKIAEQAKDGKGSNLPGGAIELTSEQAKQLQALLASFQNENTKLANKGPIGFQPPKPPETDPSKMN